ncbi:MAG: ISNCY family transposase [Desulfobulbaceae bacterium]|nr:ISNCY family transposase [Desulfobulbaceae bacterium]
MWEALLPPEALVMPAELVAVDRLLDDPRFFEPFREHFDPVWGRPSIPIETYLRLMFLKYRYRLGYETLCGEVTDSLSWLRFCRIPIGEAAPHPSTLMKLTTKFGPETIEALNGELIAAAVEEGLVDVSWLRADTTVVPANIKYPTDSGLLTKGIAKITTLVGRIQSAGAAGRTLFDDETPAARQAAHRIGSKLRRRNETARAEVLEITGELAVLAELVCEQAKRVLRNAKRVGDRPIKRLRRMLADLEAAIEAVGQIITQTRLRLSGVTPDGKTRRVSLHDGDARPIRKGSLAKPTQFGYTGQVTDNIDGLVLDYEIEPGMPPDADRLAPAIARIIEVTNTIPTAVTADRGYGQTSVDVDLADLGVDLVAVLRKGKVSIKRHAIETADGFVELVKWRTGSEGRIAALKRQHGWDRTHLAGLTGARTWCGWGVLSHNLTKLAVLAD